MTDKFQNLKNKFNDLSTSKKIQLITASSLTAAFLIAAPVYHAPLKQMTV